MGFPVSDHCDGTVFFNPGNFQLPRFRDIFRWKSTSKAARWEKWIDVPTYEGVEPPANGRAAVQWINHSTFLVRSAGATFLIDPVFSPRCGPFGLIGPHRVHAPGVALESLPKIDAVLLSHDHYDHCDLPSLRALAQRCQPLGVTSLGNGGLLRRAGFSRIQELDWWESVTPSDAWSVQATPAQHWSNRLSGRRCHRLWSGFYLRVRDSRILFVGDTGYREGLFSEFPTRLGAIDLALVPIGAYEPRWFMKGQHCNPAEAVLIHREVAARRSVAMHWGTFQLTDEAREEPPLALAIARETANVPADDFVVLNPGESVTA